jgi:spore germination cell wall hydrolase CwlJ-like protein
MNRIVRAGGFAAAALALAATANFTDPSQATGSAAAPQVHYLSHADATTAPAAVADTAKVAEFAERASKLAYAAVPRPRSLDELVELYQGTETEAGEQDCLAKAVYFEARSEPLKGQLAVADVVLNRAASGKYPKGVCEVITQKAQFSFIEDGQFPEPNKASKAWRKAVAVARLAQNELAEAVPEEVLWYHADYVSPVWRHGLAKSEKIGVHIFYGPKARG